MSPIRPEGSVKVITVQQPWASLIMARATNPRAKDVENRTWTTSHRGPLAIHAGKAIDRNGFPYAEYHRIELPDPLPLGVILGTVTLVDVVQDALSSWASGGQWNWILADPVPLDVPVPARGSLGLWNWDVERHYDRGHHAATRSRTIEAAREAAGQMVLHIGSVAAIPAHLRAGYTAPDVLDGQAVLDL